MFEWSLDCEAILSVFSLRLFAALSSPIFGLNRLVFLLAVSLIARIPVFSSLRLFGVQRAMHLPIRLLASLRMWAVGQLSLLAVTCASSELRTSAQPAVQQESLNSSTSNYFHCELPSFTSHVYINGCSFAMWTTEIRTYIIMKHQQGFSIF